MISWRAFNFTLYVDLVEFRQFTIRKITNSCYPRQRIISALSVIRALNVRRVSLDFG